MELSGSVKFSHPFTCLLAGPTSSGKTFITREILKNFKVTTTINHAKLSVLWCYGQMQIIYQEPISDDVNVHYVNGMVDDDVIEQQQPDIIVVDDLMHELGDDKRLADLFTKGSHHMNISIIFIVQNLFFQAKQMRTISLNSNYYLLMKNPRDKLQIINLAKQITPGDTKYFISVYEDATKEPYSNLIIDLTPQCPDSFRLRSLKVKGDEVEFIIYIKK